MHRFQPRMVAEDLDESGLELMQWLIIRRSKADLTLTGLSKNKERPFDRVNEEQL